MSTPFLQRHLRNLRQFIRFAIVGGSGVVVNMIVAVIMNKANGGTAHSNDALFAIPGTAFNVRYYHLVWVVSFLVACVSNFQLNRSWTFKSSKHATWLSEFGPFLAVGSVAAAAGLGIITLFTHPGSFLYLPDPPFNENAGLTSRTYWAQLLTIVITMPINFVVNKLWTFRSVRHGGVPTVPPLDQTPTELDEPSAADPITADSITAAVSSGAEPPAQTIQPGESSQVAPAGPDPGR